MLNSTNFSPSHATYTHSHKTWTHFTPTCGDNNFISASVRRPTRKGLIFFAFLCSEFAKGTLYSIAPISLSLSQTNILSFYITHTQSYIQSPTHDYTRSPVQFCVTWRASKASEGRQKFQPFQFFFFSSSADLKFISTSFPCSEEFPRSPQTLSNAACQRFSDLISTDFGWLTQLRVSRFFQLEASSSSSSSSSKVLPPSFLERRKNQSSTFSIK